MTRPQRQVLGYQDQSVRHRQQIKATAAAQKQTIPST